MPSACRSIEADWRKSSSIPTIFSVGKAKRSNRPKASSKRWLLMSSPKRRGALSSCDFDRRKYFISPFSLEWRKCTCTSFCPRSSPPSSDTQSIQWQRSALGMRRSSIRSKFTVKSKANASRKSASTSTTLGAQGLFCIMVCFLYINRCMTTGIPCPYPTPPRRRRSRTCRQSRRAHGGPSSWAGPYRGHGPRNR